MANSTEGSTVSSFPPPPMHYVNKYSEENIKLNRAPKPPVPIKDSYWMFGVEFRADDPIIRPLETQGLPRLHPHNYDHKRELKKLNYSILVNFLDLLDVLIKAPESRRRLEKVDDLTLLFIHMHHLINEFRPHQARETLKVILENQKLQRQEITFHLENCTTNVRQLLNDALFSLPEELQLDSKLLVDKKSILFNQLTSGIVATANQHGKLNSIEANNNKIRPLSGTFGMIKLEKGEDGSIVLPPESNISVHSSKMMIGVDDIENCEDGEAMDCDVRDKMMCNIVDALT